jgi:hypothetical protein
MARARAGVDDAGMSIELDHAIVPARDRRKAAERLATILGVPWADSQVAPFTEVYVSDSLTLDMDQTDEPLPALHYAFRVDDAAFDAIVARLQALGIAYRGAPHGPNDRRTSAYGGGRLVYWDEPDGHVWEALTVSYARRPTG